MKFSSKILMILPFLYVLLVAQNNQASAAITTEFYPPGESSVNGNPVNLTFNGKIYTENWWFDQISTGPTGTFVAADDEKFIMNVVATYQTGTLQDIVALWAPSEQAQVQSEMSDPELFSARQNFFKNATYSAFMVKILYGSYTIFLIQHTGTKIGNTIQEFPIAKINNKYYLTNTLQSDPVFVYITDKYASSLSYKQRP